MRTVPAVATRGSASRSPPTRMRAAGRPSGVVMVHLTIPNVVPAAHAVNPDGEGSRLTERVGRRYKPRVESANGGRMVRAALLVTIVLSAGGPAATSSEEPLFPFQAARPAPPVLDYDYFVRQVQPAFLHKR